eukprot:gb/GEZN01013756.1/.p1 GENE.gb/GEZN01013756.1/~~gb/GEZN01013756.1/.p1  ORF type:complete len:300 (-),score=39.91 gb/GEZN01013756.1/:44-943(-)
MPTLQDIIAFSVSLNYCMGATFVFIVGTFLLQKSCIVVPVITKLRQLNHLLYGAFSLWLLGYTLQRAALHFEGGWDTIFCLKPELGRDPTNIWLDQKLKRAFYFYYVSKCWEFLDIWLQVLQPGGRLALGFERQFHHNFMLPVSWLLLVTDSPALLPVLALDCFYNFFFCLYMTGFYETYPAVFVLGTADRLGRIYIFSRMLFRRSVLRDPCDGQFAAEMLPLVLSFVQLAAWWVELRSPTTWPHQAEGALTCSKWCEDRMQEWHTVLQKKKDGEKKTSAGDVVGSVRQRKREGNKTKK